MANDGKSYFFDLCLGINLLSDWANADNLSIYIALQLVNFFRQEDLRSPSNIFMTVLINITMVSGL